MTFFMFEYNQMSKPLVSSNMSKQALCVSRDDVLTRNFPDWSLTLEPRSVVDNLDAPDPTVKQFIPYVVILKADPTGPQVLAYQRGNAGDESRLWGNWSIGFGGHVETMPAQGVVLFEHLAEDAHRECLEEMGIELNLNRLEAAIARALIVKNFVMLEDSKVESVHLCVPIFYVLEESEVPAFDKMVGETSVICNLGFKNLVDLKHLADEGQVKLERWTEWALKMSLDLAATNTRLNAK